jgi:hypothetical protein
MVGHHPADAGTPRSSHPPIHLLNLLHLLLLLLLLLHLHLHLLLLHLLNLLNLLHLLNLLNLLHLHLHLLLLHLLNLLNLLHLLNLLNLLHLLNLLNLLLLTPPLQVHRMLCASCFLCSLLLLIHCGVLRLQLPLSAPCLVRSAITTIDPETIDFAMIEFAALTVFDALLMLMLGAMFC